MEYFLAISVSDSNSPALNNYTGVMNKCRVPNISKDENTHVLDRRSPKHAYICLYLSLPRRYAQLVSVKPRDFLPNHRKDEYSQVITKNRQASVETCRILVGEAGLEPARP